MSTEKKIVPRLKRLLSRESFTGKQISEKELLRVEKLAPILLPPALKNFYRLTDGWHGYLGEQFFKFYCFEESIRRTEELFSEIDFPTPVLAIGDNGASEVFFIDAEGAIYLGDEIGLPESMIQVSESLVALLERPELIEEAFERCASHSGS